MKIKKLPCYSVGDGYSLERLPDVEREVKQPRSKRKQELQARKIKNSSRKRRIAKGSFTYKPVPYEPPKGGSDAMFRAISGGAFEMNRRRH